MGIFNNKKNNQNKPEQKEASGMKGKDCCSTQQKQPVKQASGTGKK